MNRTLVSAAIAAMGATVLSVAALAVYAASGTTSDGDGTAGVPHPHHMHHGGPGMGFMNPGMLGPQLLHRLGDKLQLTDQQRATIKGLLESARPNMKAMHEEMR